MRLNYLILFILTVLAASCGGGLSNEQRAQLKEEMKEREIVKISEDEIMVTALELGRTTYPQLLAHSESDSNFQETDFTYSIITNTTNIENELFAEIFEAYNFAAQNGVIMDDNIQRDGDFLIYTIPYIKEDLYEGVLFIRFEKKKIIQSLQD